MKEVLEKFLGIDRGIFDSTIPTFLGDAPKLELAQKQVPSFIGFGSNAVHRLTRFLYLEGMGRSWKGLR